MTPARVLAPTEQRPDGTILDNHVLNSPIPLRMGTAGTYLREDIERMLAHPDFPWHELPRSKSRKEDRIVGSIAPVEFIFHSELWARRSGQSLALMWGAFSFLITSFMCGWGVIPGAYYGYYTGMRLGMQSYDNLLDDLHERHARDLAEAEKQRKRATRDQFAHERDERRRAKQDPALQGLLGLGYTREECLRALAAVPNEPDTGKRIGAAIRFLGAHT